MKRCCVTCKLSLLQSYETSSLRSSGSLRRVKLKYERVDDFESSSHSSTSSPRFIFLNHVHQLRDGSTARHLFIRYLVIHKHPYPLAVRRVIDHFYSLFLPRRPVPVLPPPERPLKKAFKELDAAIAQLDVSGAPVALTVDASPYLAFIHSMSSLRGEKVQQMSVLLRRLYKTFGDVRSLVV